MRPLAKLCVRRVDESAFLCRKNISGGVNGGSSFRGSIPTRVVVQKHGCHSNPSNRIEQRRRSSRQSLNAATYLMATPVDKLVVRIELNERHVRFAGFLLLLLEKGIDAAFCIRLNGLHGTASVNNHRDVCQISSHRSHPSRSSNGEEGKSLILVPYTRTSFRQQRRLLNIMPRVRRIGKEQRQNAEQKGSDQSLFNNFWRRPADRPACVLILLSRGDVKCRVAYPASIHRPSTLRYALCGFAVHD